MTYELRLVPEVEDDVRSAQTWYEQRASGLGDRFVDEFLDGIASIAENPWLFEVFEEEVRRRLFHRFPFAIYYSIQSETTKVWAVFHTARDPERIADDVVSRRE